MIFFFTVKKRLKIYMKDIIICVAKITADLDS